MHHSNATLTVRRVTVKMIVRVLALASLFLLKLITEVVAEFFCERYGVDAVKRLCKFEQFDFEIKKNEADLKFL